MKGKKNQKYFCAFETGRQGREEVGKEERREGRKEGRRRKRRRRKVGKKEGAEIYF
jgi:hypothetical protein